MKFANDGDHGHEETRGHANERADEAQTDAATSCPVAGWIGRSWTKSDEDFVERTAGII